MNAPAGRVLVIDDQADERAIQIAMLSHLGYAVDEAADGESGLRSARESPPDVILLDIAMPRMDGFEVCRRLRADESTAHIPVLLFTASAVVDLEQKAEEAGAAGVLPKPIEPQRVALAVGRLIGGPTPPG